MEEYERVKKEALLTDEEIRNSLKDSALQLSADVIDEISSDARRVAQAQLDKVLKADSIEIRTGAQGLPENTHSPMTDGKFGTFGEGQESLLKPDSEGRVWVKVILKGS